MADSTIWNLNAETAMTAVHRVPVQETGASTRALHATFALLGGLEYTTSGDAAISAAVGTLYYVDVGAFTADRTLTLPATAAVGERVGVFVETGDDTYELILQANTGDTLNGVTAAEWSRVYITGECVIMRCVVANTTWIVEYDGRIPCLSIANNNAAQSVASGDVLCILNTSIVNRGMTQTLTAGNYSITARRSGYYQCMVRGRHASLSSGDLSMFWPVSDNAASEEMRMGDWQGANGSSTVIAGGILKMDAGNKVQAKAHHNNGSNKDIGSASWNFTRLSALEILGPY